MKEYQQNWYSYVRQSFDQHRHISRIKIAEIEYFFRLGKKNYELMIDKSVKNVAVRGDLRSHWLDLHLTNKLTSGRTSQP
jgi:hypothetical protein